MRASIPAGTFWHHEPDREEGALMIRMFLQTGAPLLAAFMAGIIIEVLKGLV